MISKLLQISGTGLLTLLAVIAATWAVDVGQSQPPLPQMQAVAPVAGAAQAQELTARPRPDATFYGVLVERPLFAPTRRPVLAEPEPEPIQTPVIAPVPQPVDDEEPAPQLRLLGVVGTQTSNRALVSIEDRPPVWLTLNDAVVDWTVSDIGPDWFEITRNAETLRIEMYQ